MIVPLNSPGPEKVGTKRVGQSRVKPNAAGSTPAHYIRLTENRIGLTICADARNSRRTASPKVRQTYCRFESKAHQARERSWRNPAQITPRRDGRSHRTQHQRFLVSAYCRSPGTITWPVIVPTWEALPEHQCAQRKTNKGAVKIAVRRRPQASPIAHSQGQQILTKTTPTPYGGGSFCL